MTRISKTGYTAPDPVLGYATEGEDVREAETELLSCLRTLIRPGDTQLADELFTRLRRVIDAKIAYHKDDLSDKIDERGVHDPHY